MSENPAETDDRYYNGDPWHADESAESVRFFRGHYQVFKAPKHGTDHAEYWPSPTMIVWMLEALNNAEKIKEPPASC